MKKVVAVKVIQALYNMLRNSFFVLEIAFLKK